MIDKVRILKHIFAKNGIDGFVFMSINENDNAIVMLHKIMPDKDNFRQENVFAFTYLYMIDEDKHSPALTTFYIDIQTFKTSKSQLLRILYDFSDNNISLYREIYEGLLDFILDISKKSQIIIHNLSSTTFLEKGTTLEQLAIECDLNIESNSNV